MILKHRVRWTLGLLSLVCMAALAVTGCGSGPSESATIAVTTSLPEPPATKALGPGPTSTPQPGLTPISPQSTGTPPSATQSATHVVDDPTPTATVEPSAGASPTAVPEPSATATNTRTPVPEVRSFTVEPREVRNVGDHVRVTWEAVGEQAELCSTNCFGPTMCQDVPLSGNLTLVSDEASLGTNGFALQVSSGDQTAVEPVAVRFLCDGLRTWFFEPPPPYCPVGEPSASYAAGQGFERGFMVWVEDTDEFYVFDAEPDASGRLLFYRTVGLELKPGASEQNRIGEDPPPGLYEPVSGFGLIWRAEVEWPEIGNVRERLGWAIEPEFGFDTTSQGAMLACPRGWITYMRAPHGEILRLGPASTAGFPLVWEDASP